MNAAGPTVRSKQERADLILAFLPRVRWIAARVHERSPYAVLLEDLISVGVLGLITAIDRFDASLNVKLTTYADYRIRGSMLDSIRSLYGVPLRKRPKMKMMHRAAAAAAQRLHTSPDEEQIANELGISLNEYHEWLLEVRPHSVSSLDCTLTVGAHSVKLADVLPDDSGLEPDQVLERVQLRQLVDRALSCLPPTEYRVMHFYYREGIRIHEIAHILGLHPSRIWQMKHRATGRVREFIQESWQMTKGRKPDAATSNKQDRYAAVAD